MTKRMIAIASDHGGYQLKELLKKTIPTLSSEFEILDLGPISSDAVDYPDFAAKMANTIKTNPATSGILICGSGIGMSIAANRYPWIRAALVENLETARLSREHNDANVLCLGERIISKEKAQEIVKIWLTTPFSNEPRHKTRIGKLSS